MVGFIQFVQTLVSLGPYLIQAWQLIQQLINSHKQQTAGQVKMAEIVAADPELSNLWQLSTVLDQLGGGSLRASGAGFPTLAELLQVFAYITAHPELKQAVQTIINAVVDIKNILFPAGTNPPPVIVPPVNPPGPNNPNPFANA